MALLYFLGWYWSNAFTEPIINLHNLNVYVITTKFDLISLTHVHSHVRIHLIDESPQNPPETAATKQSTNKQSASKQSIIKESAHKQPPSADKTTTLDLETANAVIQRQHSQIQALLQQQQQASTLLGPALQGLLAKATDSDLVSLLKQSQELAAAKEAHNLMEASRANGEPPPAQMSNNRPIVSNRDQHGEFNTVSFCLMCVTAGSFITV